jgi:putative hemolysin
VSHVVPVLLTLICLVISFSLSGMEAGVFALNRLRIRHRMREGDGAASLLIKHLDNPEDFLWTILVGNSLANFIAVCLVVAGLHYWLEHYFWLKAAAFLMFVFLLYALCDLLPKILFQSFPNRLCLGLARPFSMVHFILTPIVRAMAWLSRSFLKRTGAAYEGRLFGNREELRLLMLENSQSFSSEERLMINRVFDLQNLTVRHIAVPLSHAAVVSDATSMNKVLDLCRARNLTRVLVVQEKDPNRRVAGIVSLKTVLYRQDLDLSKTAGDYIKPALFLDENLRLEDALRRMQRSGQKLAVVLGRERRETGLVSLQDILKAIFGEVSL